MKKTAAHRVLTPQAFELLHAVARTGSMAAAARHLGLVPSALTYRVRQIEQALDVLLFDRRGARAEPTAAGLELLREGQRLLAEIDAVAKRVQRVATGWETQFTVAVDSILSPATVMELAQAFFDLGAPTKLKLREETLSGTLAALRSGQADLALGVSADVSAHDGLRAKPLGQVAFVFAVAPQHPLAKAPQPLVDTLIRQYRAVAAADTGPKEQAITTGLLSEQEVFTVPNVAAKLDAQLRGLGCGFLPQALAQPYIQAGRLVACAVEREERLVRLSYAWRSESAARHGLALRWWLRQLEHTGTRQALLPRATISTL